MKRTNLPPRKDMSAKNSDAQQRKALGLFLILGLLTVGFFCDGGEEFC